MKNLNSSIVYSEFKGAATAPACATARKRIMNSSEFGRIIDTGLPGMTPAPARIPATRSISSAYCE